MPERWRRELRRLSSASPSDELFRRAQQGPRRELEPERRRSGVIAVAAVLAVCTAAGLLSWQAFGRNDERGAIGAPSGPSGSSDTSGSTSAAPANTGYFIAFPDHAEAKGEFDATVTATTNLPEGTRLQISTTDEGSCCPQVKGGQVIVETQNSACFGHVGGAADSPGFDATITARPDLDTLAFSGPAMPGGDGSSGPRSEQPASVVRELGEHFEHLAGDQVVVQDDGSKWLVAHARFQWPEPQCGGDPFPLFGGTATHCDDGDSDGGAQLQGHGIESVMVEVIGAISQARMCEFYATFLPPDVEASHPWPDFAAQWREWLLRQDFSDLDGSVDWETGPLHWVPAARHGSVYVIDVVHDGERIATLEVRPLPDYCPDCGSNVVPFWGVTAWTLN